MAGLTVLAFGFATLTFAAAQSGPQPVVFDSDPLVIETAAGPKSFRVELAITPQQRATGLMYRQSMPEDAGMLFDFSTPRVVNMWMRNTLLPLDMIFIAEGGAVVTIVENTVPYSEAVISSGEPVRYVLEINSGLATVHGIKPGDRVHHPAIAGVDEDASSRASGTGGD